MAEIKLTKNELRAQEKKLGQLNKYLPTLQLKKAMLQSEIYEARIEILKSEEFLEETSTKVEEFASLLSQKISFNPSEAAKVKNVDRRYENIAGVDVPYFKGISFEDFHYVLFDSPAWIDSVILGLRSIAEAKAKVLVAREKKEALEKELRLVSIRVNLFEKILIPRAKKNIKKIKVFLGDQDLAAVSRAKVAKLKLEERQENKAVKEV